MPWYVWLIGGCLGLVALGVLAVAVITGLFVSTFVNIAHQPQQSLSRSATYTVTGAPTITITNPVGNVSIQRGQDSAVTVHATASAQDATSTQTQRDLDSIDIATKQTGNTIDLSVTMSQVTGPLGGNRHVDLDITVPQQSTVRVNLSVGHLTMAGISGQVSANVETGDADIRQGTLWDGSQVRTNVGSVTYQGALAANTNVDFQANTGNVALMLPADTATNLDAAASVGSITITGWNVPLSKTTTGQSASGPLGSPSSGRLRIRTNVGSIALHQG